MLAYNSAWLLHSGGIEGNWLFFIGSSLLSLVLSSPPWLDSPVEFQPPERAGSRGAEHSLVEVDIVNLEKLTTSCFLYGFLDATHCGYSQSG